MTKRVAILLFPGFDLIDAGGPYEVFLTASRLAERGGLSPQYEVRSDHAERTARQLDQPWDPTGAS